MLFVAVGYEVFALLPPFAKNYADVSERWIGFIWLANTLLIVLLQLPVSKALEGRRRMAALALMNLLWAVAALIVLAAGGLLTATSAALVFVVATMVFGLGEILQGPTQAPLVADLRPSTCAAATSGSAPCPGAPAASSAPPSAARSSAGTRSPCGPSPPPSAWLLRSAAYSSSADSQGASGERRSPSP